MKVKETYIKPHLRWVDLYQESLMAQISVKIVDDDDEEEYEEAANEGFFEDNEQYWKQKIWK